MEKVKSGLSWVTRNFFIISIIIFLLAYSLIYWLGGLLGNFRPAYALLFIYAISTALYQKVKIRSCVRIILLFSTILLWLMNFEYVKLTLPSIEDTGYYNSTAYILLSDNQFVDQPYSWFSMAKWEWWQMPNTTVIDVFGNLGHVSFVYDEQRKIVGVVGSRGLRYTDGEPPRDYENGPEYKGHKYYLSSECIKWAGKYDCENYRHTIYQCNLQNIGCVQIPFQYTGVEWLSDLVFNEITQELDFYVTRIANQTADDKDILVYSYGPNPRCYVEGCEILDTP